MPTNFVQMQDPVLQSGISSSDTNAIFNKFVDIYGNVLANSDFGNIRVGTLERNTSREEIVLFSIDSNTDGVANVTLTRGQEAKTPYASGGISYSHPAGSTLTISDNPQLLDTLLAKDNDQTITGQHIYDTLPESSQTPSDVNHFTTKAYVDSVATGDSELSNSQVLIAGDAGETVSAGDVVYLDETDGEWYQTDADVLSTVGQTKIGIAQGAGTDGNIISGGIVVGGIDKSTTYTAGQVYYVSNTKGDISTSVGSIERIVGIGDKNGNLVIVDPYELTKDEKDAIAGGGDLGTPSSSNKFVTEEGISNLGNPSITVYTSDDTWTKPAGLKYVEIELVGGGGNGGAAGSSSYRYSGSGGGAGGYSKKIIAASTLGATETVTVGAAASSSSFGTHASATGGSNADRTDFGAGGTGSGGDINLEGEPGQTVTRDGSAQGGQGGWSELGSYGRGGQGAQGSYDGVYPGEGGASGVVIVTEYFAST